MINYVNAISTSIPINLTQKPTEKRICIGLSLLSSQFAVNMLFGRTAARIQLYENCCLYEMLVSNYG